ncbi:acyltransferase domain-containing protein [Paenibacillus sp. P26]|nr:acyltransferase domain-containing protein [Paenibacillus sp. P26]UUZ95269.1 acyltransferase domain-containing protein [Paenibacillus sp. P25]
MRRPIVFLFSGQGSQYYQMGRELYLHHDLFRHWMQLLDNGYYSISGQSVVDELYSREIGSKFDRLVYTHPAIFMVEYALAQVLMENRIYPDYVLGTSLGEFASIAAARALDYKTALECLTVQAKLVEEHCRPGGMTAILDSCTLYETEPLLNRNTELASVNYESHFVVSGGAEGLSEAEACMRGKGILYQRLPVNYGFHSGWIDEAAAPYKRFLGGVSLKPPQVPLVSGFLGDRCGTFESDYLWKAVREPIQFRSALRSLNPADGAVFIDLGPSGTLANFVKHNLAQGLSDVYTIMTPFHKDVTHLERVIEAVNSPHA